MAKQFKGLAKDFISAMKTHFIGKGADPNDIFVQDLYNYQSKTPELVNSILKDNNLNNIHSLSNQEREILQSLLQVYNDNITTKRDILTQSRQLFETDIIQTVVDVMIDDGFNSFNNEKEEFRIEYHLSEEDKDNLGEEHEEQVQNVIDEFVKKFNLKSKVADLVPELLRDGEYALGILSDEKGIVSIVDDLDVINLLPFYEGNELSFVINEHVYSDGNTKRLIGANQNKITAYRADNIVFFRLNNSIKKRINMSNFYDTEFRNNFLKTTGIRLPKYIRMSMPIYASAMRTLSRLKLMENVSTVLDLNDVLKPEIVHVTVPTNTSATEAQQIIRDYERQINDIGELSNTDNLDLTTLATQANRRKVLPQWMDSKGSLNSAAINQAGKGESAWNSINNLRNLIALSIGIPPFYLNITDQGMDKAQTIKIYSRYTRKLTSLQKCLAEGIKDIILKELNIKGINVARDNISVKFKAITSGDSLDDTDMMVATVAGINDLYKAIEEIASSENNNLTIDSNQFKQLFDNLTSRYLNISDLLIVDENKFDNQEFGDDEEFAPSISRPHKDSDRDVDFSNDFETDFEDSEEIETPSTTTDAGEDVYNDFVNATNNLELEEM